MPPTPATLDHEGCGLAPGLFSGAEIAELTLQLGDVFVKGAGQRALLARPEVESAAARARARLAGAGWLSPDASAVQAIAFNKTPGANWKVAWHQDLQFPFAGAEIAPGCSGACRKDGLPYGQPPAEVLAGLLAVRVHLDDCDDENGPLRVLPGTHRAGVLEDEEIEECKTRVPARVCLAQVGDAILMRPLLLHASSAALVPRQRRVLHFVFAEVPLPSPARWSAGSVH